MLKFSENFKYSYFLRLAWHTSILQIEILAVPVFLPINQGAVLVLSC